MRAVDVANYLVERWGRCYPATIHKLNRLVYLVQAEVEPDAARLIDSVAEKYGPLSAFDLVSLVRRPGGVWARVYAPGREAEITSDAIGASADASADASKPEPFSVTLDAVARNMPFALKMLETS